LCWLLAGHALVLMVGGHYTYAEVPLGLWAQDAFGLARNHYDRLGHFMQGFVPAVLVRELLLRTSPLVRGRWLFALVTCACLAFSAFFEMIEWWSALVWGGRADAFLASCRDLSGARVDFRRRQVRWDGRTVRVRVYPISIDLEHLRATARSAEAEAPLARLRRWKGDRRLILRVDRTDLSKNVLRGFLAYERFLLSHPEWHGRVAFLALLNPSRQDLPEYRAYLEDCVRVVERINEAFGQEGWQPIELSIEDDLFRAVAAYGLYDVLLVNPVFDGMNLVAKEGPALNRHDGVLVLSENAGSYAELGRYALGINPFDVGATAEAVAHALEMDAEERTRRGRGLKAAIRRNRLEDWVGRQVRDLERAAASRR